MAIEIEQDTPDLLTTRITTTQADREQLRHEWQLALTFVATHVGPDNVDEWANTNIPTFREIAKALRMEPTVT